MPTRNPQDERRPSHDTRRTGLPSPLSVLLLSADPDCRAQVEHALLRGQVDEGISLVVTDDVDEAIERLTADAFEALLVDVSGFAGERLAHLEQVRRAGVRLPVLILSEEDDQEEALAALRAGAQDYVAFPAEGSRRLVRSLRHAMERHRLIDQLEVARHSALHAATHDALTQLPNRYLLEQQMQRVLPQAARSRSSAALLYLDLDRFKSINDTLGHSAGDLVLTQVSQRLARCTRLGDVVARVGGDEFLILLSDIGGDHAPSAVANKIHAEMREPFRLDGREFWLGVSIGISVFPRDGSSPEALIRSADLALYQAKANGRAQSHFYNEDLNSAARSRHAREQGLRRALESGGLRIVYQPIVDAASLDVVGAEALLRWNDPNLGVVPPSEFIPVAEEIGLIVPLGDAVIRTACEQLAQWKRDGHRLRMMVNVSAHQIAEERLRRTVVQALWDSDIAPGELELEVTESALMRDEEEAIRTFRALKRMGVCISLDDFGTGFSSLNYLKRFPVDTVKIDRSFVRDLAFDADDAAIVAAILSIARQLDLRVVAEGVETDDQRVFLTERRCSWLQGFLLSPPLPPDAFGELLRTGIAIQKEEDER